MRWLKTKLRSEIWDFQELFNSIINPLIPYKSRDCDSFDDTIKWCPNLDKGTKCVKILPSLVSKGRQKPLFSMLFPIFWAIWPQNEKPLFRSRMVGYFQIMVGYHPIMQGYCPVKDAYSMTDDRWQFSHEHDNTNHSTFFREVHSKVPLCHSAVW